MQVVKRDGSLQEFDGNKIVAVLKKIKKSLQLWWLICIYGTVLL